MTDAELLALAALLNADTQVVQSENELREMQGHGPAYSGEELWNMDAYKTIEAELRRRGVLKEVKP